MKELYCKICGKELENGKCVNLDCECSTKPVTFSKEMKSCDVCKKKISEDSIYCPFCGMPTFDAKNVHLQNEIEGDYAIDVIKDEDIKIKKVIHGDDEKQSEEAMDKYDKILDIRRMKEKNKSLILTIILVALIIILLVVFVIIFPKIRKLKMVNEANVLNETNETNKTNETQVEREFNGHTTWKEVDGPGFNTKTKNSDNIVDDDDEEDDEEIEEIIDNNNIRETVYAKKKKKKTTKSEEKNDEKEVIEEDNNEKESDTNEEDEESINSKIETYIESEANEIIIKERLKQEETTIAETKAQVAETVESVATMQDNISNNKSVSSIGYTVATSDNQFIKMRDGFLENEGYIYCLDNVGDPVVADWTSIKEADGSNSYYYFDIDGRLVVDSWIEGEYYVGNDGKMLRNTTTPDGAVVDMDGKVVIKSNTIDTSRNYIFYKKNETKMQNISSETGVIKGTSTDKPISIKALTKITDTMNKGNDVCNIVLFYPTFQGKRQSEVDMLNEKVSYFFQNDLMQIIKNKVGACNELPRNLSINQVDQKSVTNSKYRFNIEGKLTPRHGLYEKFKYRLIFDRKTGNLQCDDISNE